MRLVLAVSLLLAAVPSHAHAALGLVTEDGRRTPITAPGESGLLTSDSTRIDGLVTPEDVASGRLRIVPDDDPAAALRTLDRRIERNERWHLPLTIG
ncbi:MAG: hypothetical protein WEB13_01245, partial [Dehalococcoidia bacterium]